MKSSRLSANSLNSLLLTFCFCLVCSGLSGCATLRALIPGGVTAADAEWSGVKSGPVISMTASLSSDPRAAALATLLASVGQNDPLGVLLPLTVAGETVPRWVFCDQTWAEQCSTIKVNVMVDFAGSPIGPGLLWRPSRLKAHG